MSSVFLGGRWSGRSRCRRSTGRPQLLAEPHESPSELSSHRCDRGEGLATRSGTKSRIATVLKSLHQDSMRQFQYLIFGYDAHTPTQTEDDPMIAWQRNFRSSSRGLASLVMMLAVVGTSVTPSTSIASASSEVSICASRQLAVAIASSSGAYFAAGNVGIPFVIINISKSTCALEGYPRLTMYPAGYRANKVKVVNGGGMIFVSVRPKIVIIGPGSTASFGLDYGDAYYQQDPNAGPCMTKQMTVFLPTRSHPFAQPYNTTVNINFCYAGFRFDITSIQRGPIAKVA